MTAGQHPSLGSKPVDIDHLVSVLRVSIQRADALKLASDTVVPLLPQAS